MMHQDPASLAGPPRIDPKEIHVDAQKVLRRLTSQGFRAYLVGGCVRDLLLHRRPKDFDIATSARPRQVKRVFRNSRIIGRRFRLVHVRFGDRILEVATFRAPPLRDEEDPYVRRDNVFGTEEQDAFRRDFTINGLFYDVEAERVIDHVGGLEDLAGRRVRMIGDPEERLREDPIRILRAAKFAGRLDFELTPELAEAARHHARDLEKAAPPRVLEEFYRLLSNHGAARSFELLEELGALEVLLPEIAPPKESFYRSLKKLEELTHGERNEVPQWLMIAVLLAPTVREPLARTEPTDYEHLVGEVLRPIGLRLTVARRDLTAARQGLAAQVRLLHPPQGAAARRFVRREVFPHALQLRNVIGRLEEVDPDPVREWNELAREVHAALPKRKRRRRRRGGRRRRLSEKAQTGKDGTCPSPHASSSAPAPRTPPKTSPGVSSSGDSSPA